MTNTTSMERSQAEPVATRRETGQTLSGVVRQAASVGEELRRRARSGLHRQDRTLIAPEIVWLISSPWLRPV